MPFTITQKLAFLHEIKARKAILFGSFNDTKEGKKSKMEAWEDIKRMCQSISESTAFLLAHEHYSSFVQQLVDRNSELMQIS